MKRWSQKAFDSVEVPEVDEFLAEIASVCRKHGMSLGVVGSPYAAIAVEDFTPASVNQLLASDDRRC